VYEPATIFDPVSLSTSDRGFEIAGSAGLSGFSAAGRGFAATAVSVGAAVAVGGALAVTCGGALAETVADSGGEIAMALLFGGALAVVSVGREVVDDVALALPVGCIASSSAVSCSPRTT
jgi:hypothetical protein